MYNKGDIVLVSFPFSDFKEFKLRPVLVWENLGNDVIVMPITSSKINIFGEFFLEKNSLNNLKVDSFIKPFNINTISKDILKAKLGKLSNIELNLLETIFCNHFCNN